MIGTLGILIGENFLKIHFMKEDVDKKKLLFLIEVL